YAPHHYSIRAARDQDYERFIRRELKLRQELGWPPFTRMALVRIEGADAAAVAAMAQLAADALTANLKNRAVRGLGPAPAPIERLRGRYRWQVMVKAAEHATMRAALLAMQKRLGANDERGDVFVGVDIDPVNMM